MTNDPQTQITIREGDLVSLVLFVALGVLHSIEQGKVPSSVGIWTLAPPRFIRFLQEHNLPDELIGVLSQCDELSAIEKLLGTEQMQKSSRELIQTLEGWLTKLTDPNIFFQPASFFFSPCS